MKRLMAIYTTLLCFALCSEASVAKLNIDAGVVLDDPHVELKPMFFDLKWSSGGIRHSYGIENFPRKDRPAKAELTLRGDNFFDVKANIEKNGRGVRARYDFVAQATTNLNRLCVAFKIPVAEAAGGKWSVDGKSGIFPREKKTAAVRGNAIAEKLQLKYNGKRLAFAFDTTCELQIQDDRFWNADVFTIRISLPERSFVKGKSYSLAFTIDAGDGVVEPKWAEPYVIKSGKDWIPLKYFKNIEHGSALDFSSMGLCDAPAGKYGWLKNVDGHFEFEKRPGKSQRFYGANTVFTCSFAEKKVSSELAERLKCLGYNTARIHHHDNSLSHGNTENFERLDYFLAELFKRGIYVTTDCFCSRRVKWTEIGEKRDGIIEMPWYKALVMMHEGAYQDLVAFTRSFLGHVNPYTGRSYAEEPGIPLISIVNENDITWRWHEFYEEPWLVAEWQKWLKRKREKDHSYDDVPNVPSRIPGVNTKERSAREHFMAEHEAAFFARFRSFLRDELHCKALLTDQNCGGPLPLQPVRAKYYDYVDDHFYVDHPAFLEKRWSLPSKCPNVNPLLGDKPLPACDKAFNHLAGKPLTITEFNFSGPGMYRGVGGILTGAMGALQDWDGIWRFAYSHSSASLPASTPVRIGYFDLVGDPLSQATDRAAICLFLRGDLPPLKKGIALTLPPGEIAQLRNRGIHYAPSWKRAAWNNRIRIVADDTPETGAPVSFGEAFSTNSSEQMLAKLPCKASNADALALDHQRGSFTINTALTCGGFAENGEFQAGNIGVRLEETPATVWASSLDGKPLPQSSRILVSHVTDVQNDQMVYAEEERRILLNWGKSPTLARNGRADVTLWLDAPEAYDVYTLETTGRRLRKLPVETTNRTLRFRANVDGGSDGAMMLYEVVKK